MSKCSQEAHLLFIMGSPLRKLVDAPRSLFIKLIKVGSYEDGDEEDDGMTHILRL